MQVIPLTANPSQTLTVPLGTNQICRINVYQKFYGLFIDLYVNGNLIIGGVLAENLNRIVRSTYLGFSGDLAFYDTQGNDDPDYTGLVTRWQLLYLSPSDLIAAIKVPKTIVTEETQADDTITPPAPSEPSFDFSDPDNSQYIPLL